MHIHTTEPDLKDAIPPRSDGASPFLGDRSNRIEAELACAFEFRPEHK